MPGSFYRRVVLALALGLIAASWSTAVSAKRIALATPSGRTIYGPDEQFGEVSNQRNRSFVAEVAMGAGPEGNLGLLLGWLNVPWKRFDIYAGVGFEGNPAQLYTLGSRYAWSLDGYHPYISLGYVYKNTYELDMHSANVFGELGYRWSLHQTYRVSAGVGLRRQFHISVGKDSPLNGPEIDPVFRDEQLDSINPWLPTLALRFSRVF